jgi:hypothetical protein
MGNIGDTISESPPAVSTAGPGYASTINDLLTEFKARLVSKIPLSALLTNSDLDLNGRALLNTAYITMVNESLSPVASPSNRFTSYAGDAWWVSPSGAVQITSGNQLNAAGIGGITGDYSAAGPMEFRYDTANTRYDAYANFATNTWAYVRSRGFDIAGSATSAFRFRQTYTGTSNQAVIWNDATSFGDGIMTLATGTVTITESIDTFSQTHHSNRHNVISAYDLMLRGYFSGAGTGSISVASNVPKYRLDTAGGVVTIPVYLDNEGTTSSSIPILVNAIFWKGLINGGGFPTIELFVHRSTGGGVLDAKLPVVQSVALNAATNTSDVVETVLRTVTTPTVLLGGEYLTARITAGTNNCDTYEMAIKYDKQV